MPPSELAFILDHLSVLHFYMALTVGSLAPRGTMTYHCYMDG